MRDLAVAPVADTRPGRTRSPARLSARRGRKAANQGVKSPARQQLPHAVGFDQRGGQEVVSARLPGLAVRVPPVPARRLAAQICRQIARAAGAAIVQRQGSAKAVLACDAGADRIGRLAAGKPRTAPRRSAARAPAPPTSGVFGRRQRQFGRQLQQPRPAIGALEPAARGTGRDRRVRRRPCSVMSCASNKRADGRGLGHGREAAAAGAPASSSRARTNASRSCRRRPGAGRGGRARPPRPSARGPACWDTRGSHARARCARSGRRGPPSSAKAGINIGRLLPLNTPNADDIRYSSLH